VSILRQWLPYYERRFGPLSGRQRQLVRQVSRRPWIGCWQRRGRSIPSGAVRDQTGSLLRSEIPIRTGTWDLSRPGYLEADSVAHCGGSLAGSFIWSLTYTDILSGWTEGGAVWNKGAAGVLAATRQVEERLPFALLDSIRTTAGNFSIITCGLTCESASRGGVYPFPTLPLRRQRACGAKKLDVAGNFWAMTLGRPGVGGADQRAVSGGMGPWQNFFLPCLKLEQKWRREVTGTSAMKSPRPPMIGFALLECCP